MPLSTHFKFAAFLALSTFYTLNPLLAQEPQSIQVAEPTQDDLSALACNTRSTDSAPPAKIENDQITVPAGTRLPLILRNSLGTRNARAGNSVYFQTVYPIGVGKQMAIPMGTFARGVVTEAKRPGRMRGRGEVRIVLDQLTFPNGYTLDLIATPNSVENNGREQVSPDGKITGPGGLGKDAATIALGAVAGGPAGGYVGLLAGSARETNLAIGHGAGAAIGLAIVLFTRGPEAELPRGTMIDVIFDKPLKLDPRYLPSAEGVGPDPQAAFQAPPVQRSKARRREQRRNGDASFLIPMLLFAFL